MKSLKILFAGMLASAFAFSPATAQENGKDYLPYPYNFIGVQGGGQVTFTNCPADKLVTPIGAVSVGRFFTPTVGARLNVSGWQNKGGFKVDKATKTYDYKYVTSDLDLMINLSNIFYPKKAHWFNAILIGGVGLSYAWDNDDLKELTNMGVASESMAWDDDRLVHNFRVGMQFEVNISKHLGVNLEVTANNLHDRFNSKQNGHGDWQANALVGLTYKFGFRKRPVSTSASAMAQQDYDASRNANMAVTEAPKVVEEPKPQPKPVVKQPESSKVEIFFDINESDVKASESGKLADFAQWMKNHPTAKVHLTGYADAGTGNAAINRAISEKRTAAVKKMLTDKYGIAADRISTDYKGDTVQPFSDNDKNRVTIGVAEEQ